MIMAIASKETLEMFSGELKKQMFDTVTFGAGFISFGACGVEHIRFEDIFISCYQSLLNKYESQSDELKHCNNLEF